MVTILRKIVSTCVINQELAVSFFDQAAHAIVVGLLCGFLGSQVIKHEEQAN